MTTGRAGRVARPWSWAARRYAAALWAAVIVVAVGFCFRFGLPPGDGYAIATCRQLYAAARTAADIAAIDRQAPMLARGDATAALTCGTRRAAGQLR